MNSTQTLINLFVSRGRDGTITQWKISSLVILGLVIILVTLGVYAGISAVDDTATMNATPSVSGHSGASPNLKPANIQPSTTSLTELLCPSGIVSGRDPI